MNTLYYGDNLTILQKHVSDASVDLVYLDPPFNSNRDYNVLFKEQSGGESPAQIKAFGDTWNWAGAAQAWDDFPALCPVPKVIELMEGFRNAIGENDVMAYLVMMAPRLYHLHRVLKPTGSLYLHCDPTASHYLRLILDGIFGPKNFKNEIIWKRTSSHNDTRRKYGNLNDTIYFYTKSDTYNFKVQYAAYDEAYIESFYRFADENGRRYRVDNLRSPNPRPNLTYDYKGYKPHPNGWAVSRERMEQLDSEGRLYFPKKPDGRIQLKRFLDEMQGVPLGNVWDDLPPIHAHSAERLGYPTQKPLALLERIVSASSNPGDVVLDPFCGCGTAIVAAEKLGRKWLGIDITSIATSLVQKRLNDSFGARDARLLGPDDRPERAFAVVGLPTDVPGARRMFAEDHKKFEMWAVGLIPAIPQEKKGADKGIDGVAYFHDNPKTPSKAIVQVKGGHVTRSQIATLHGDMIREKAALGFFITLEKPTSEMLAEARAAGTYQHPSPFVKPIEKIQIRTIEQLLNKENFVFPLPDANVSFKQAGRVQKEVGQQAIDL